MDGVPHVITGRYRIDCEVGRGGMGTVYRALDLGLERRVAVKILKSEIAADSEVTARFMREARTMARLRHPSAAAIFDAGTLPDNRPFIVMEFVEGETLADILAREGPLPPARAVDIAGAVCDVLAAAHNVGVVHRDLKPSNIMLNARRVCVLDFGVAKVLATSADATRTHATTNSGVIVGTPRYMSPEQCLGHAVGPQSDLYSLGVLLYEMLAGRPPFTDVLPSAIIIKQATAAPPPLPTLRQNLPRALVLAVHALLAKRAGDRPQSAQAARALIERSLTHQPPPAPEDFAFGSTVATLAAGNSQPRRIFASTVCVAAVCALLLFWGRSGQGAEQLPPVNARLEALALNSLPAKHSPPGAPQQTLLKQESLAAARDVVASFTKNPIKDLFLTRTPKGSAIVANCQNNFTGARHVYAIEPRGAQYKLAARAPLDTVAFRANEWIAEMFDADGDGYGEVLYSGTSAEGEAVGGRRLVLYVARAHKFYIMRIEPTTGDGALRVLWSPNAMKPAAAPFRSLLERRARSLIAAL